MRRGEGRPFDDFSISPMGPGTGAVKPATEPVRRRESEITQEVLRLLRARGVPAWPILRESGVRRALGNERIASRIGGPGFADIVGIVPTQIVAGNPTCGISSCMNHAPIFIARGTFIALELKAPKARTAKRRALAQAAFGATVTQAGGIYLRIDPKATATACEQVCAAFGWRVEGPMRTPKEG